MGMFLIQKNLPHRHFMNPVIKLLNWSKKLSTSIINTNISMANWPNSTKKDSVTLTKAAEWTLLSNCFAYCANVSQTKLYFIPYRSELRVVHDR